MSFVRVRCVLEKLKITRIIATKNGVLIQQLTKLEQWLSLYKA